MDFAWSKEQVELRDAARALGASLDAGLVARDRDGTFDRDGWRKLADFGIHGLPVPAAFGGMGCDALTTVGVLEALGEGCRDNGLLFSINAQLWTATMPLLLFGSDEQKAKYLPGLCDGSRIGGNAMSEPEAGSDAYSLRTTATRRGDDYVLNGTKTFITNGPIADVVVVYATVDPKRGPRGISAFLVERDTPGFRVGAKLEKMGIRTSPMAELFFDDCAIPESQRLGREGAGPNLFTQSLTWERACILAPAVGAMQRLYDRSLGYAKTRKQYGQPIGKFQLVASKLIDMRIRLEHARQVLYKAAWQRDQGRSIFLEGAMAKLVISEAWVATAHDAVQIHGGYGYMTELEIERELRDAIGSKLYSGTSEVQRTIIAPLLGL